MSKIPFVSSPPSAPHLEFFPIGSDQLQRVTIDHSPFRIGRCETSDLRIDSVEVSREHAQISRRGNIWTIRDLGSTNGTQVNGRAVRESFLSDGDILTIAETEVSFVASSVTPIQRMATQPIQHRPSSKMPALLASEISHVRTVTEATLWQAIPLEMSTVTSFVNGSSEACFAVLTESAHFTDNELHAWQTAGKHYRELVRRRAIELAQAQGTAPRVFLPVDSVEVEFPTSLLDDLEQLRDWAAHDVQIGVAISLEKNIDPGALEGLYREVRHADLLLALVGFQGSSNQVLEIASYSPDYLVLSEAMLKGLSPASPPLRRLELVLATCEQQGIKAVLPFCACQKTISQCRQLGYEFAFESITSEPPADHRKLAALVS